MIQKISLISFKSTQKINNIVKNTATNPINNDRENGKATSLVGTPRGYITFKGNYDSDGIIFKDNAKKLLSIAERLAKQLKNKEIRPEHIILAAIGETTIAYNSYENKEDLIGEDVKPISTLCELIVSNSGKNLFATKPEFDYMFEEIDALQQSIMSTISEFPTLEDEEQVQAVGELKVTDNLINHLKAINCPNPDAYMLLCGAINTLINEGNEDVHNFIKDIKSVSLYQNVSDLQKNYMKEYNERALEIWNKLAIGSNLFILGKNQEERDRVLSSIFAVLNQTKRGNFNDENTLMYAISESATPEALYEEIQGIKDSEPNKKLLFFIDLDKIWLNVMEENNGVIEFKPQLIDLPSLGKDNVKLILLQSDDMHYHFMQTPLIKKNYSNFLEHNIPPVRAQEAIDIISNNKSLLKNVKTSFTKDAKEAAIKYAENLDGVLPDKAVNFMERISEYYGAEKKRITTKDVEEFVDVASDLFKKDANFSIVYDTGKNLENYYGKSTTKKDIEGIVRQIQTGKIGTQGMVIYAKDDEAGSGRKFTAQVIAGEAKVPFMEISASDFATAVEDESGAKLPPASIISKLFTDLKMAAKQNHNKTAIMYISNFEEFAFASPYLVGCKQAMSQLLREMAKAEDENLNILVMGSTYEEYVSAIPLFARGFSQTIAVDSPAKNIESRKEVIEHRLKEKKLPLACKNKAEKDALVNKLVKITEYMSFVEIKSLINKAEQIMIERNKKRATIGDFIEAYLQIEVGRTSRPEMQMCNKELTTSHECGHATNLEVMNNVYKSKGKPWFDSRDVNFITLDPRGGFLGAVFEGRTENIDYPFEAMFSDLVCAYGGHSCEKEFFNVDGSAGISQDLAQATSLAKRAVEYFGLGFNTGKISNAAKIMSVKYSENVFKDMEVILTNAQIVSDMITDQFKDFNKWFTSKYSKLIGTDDCMIDGDDFRKQLKAWIDNQPKSFKESLSIMEDMILDIIKSTKNGKIYPQVKKLAK